MYCIEKTYFFEAGHELIHHDGKCRNPHGHSYVLTIKVCDEKLKGDGPQKNMVMDFSDLNSIVNPMIHQYFDHQWLNDTLQTDSPTAEFIAAWIFHHLKPKIPNLIKVSLNETSSSKVSYSNS